MAISGARSETDLSSTFVLMATTMLLGLLTEHGSRPQPDSNGERWVGDNADGSNKFRNYVWRMLPHLVGFVPFFSAWAVLLSVYHQTVRDVDDAFDINDEVPAYIFSAIYSTCATVTLRAAACPLTPCVSRAQVLHILHVHGSPLPRAAHHPTHRSARGITTCPTRHFLVCRRPRSTSNGKSRRCTG